jgi:hypothetical protein
MTDFHFSSVLRSQYRDDLETLMFFNPQQSKVKPAIIATIEKYGIPRVVVERELLRIRVEKFAEVQTLFALENIGEYPNLSGVIVYVRTDRETIVVLHLAVKEEYSYSGILANKMLAMRLIIKLRELASRIKGVRSIMVVYGQDVIRRIPV